MVFTHLTVVQVRGQDGVKVFTHLTVVQVRGQDGVKVFTQRLNQHGTRQARAGINSQTDNIH